VSATSTLPLDFTVEHHDLFTAVYFGGLLASIITGGPRAEREALSVDQLVRAATFAGRGW